MAQGDVSRARRLASHRKHQAATSSTFSLHRQDASPYLQTKFEVQKKVEALKKHEQERKKRAHTEKDWERMLIRQRNIVKLLKNERHRVDISQGRSLSTRPSMDMGLGIDARPELVTQEEINQVEMMKVVRSPHAPKLRAGETRAKSLVELKTLTQLERDVDGIDKARFLLDYVQSDFSVNGNYWSSAQYVPTTITSAAKRRRHSRH